MFKYSKDGVITKSIKTKEGNFREYTAHKMGAISVAREGFKLISALTPSLGAGIDSLKANHDREENYEEGQSHTFGAMLQLLSENITEDHFEDLVMKLMGSIYCNDEKIKDLDDHFDKYSGDFIDILVWLFKENFGNFIMESDIVVSLIERISALLSPKMKDAVESFKKMLDKEPNEK